MERGAVSRMTRPRTGLPRGAGSGLLLCCTPLLYAAGASTATWREGASAECHPLAPQAFLAALAADYLPAALAARRADPRGACCCRWPYSCNQPLIQLQPLCRTPAVQL